MQPQVRNCPQVQANEGICCSFKLLDRSNKRILFRNVLLHSKV
uniref:Uncharacterized protein n=1 Tax=Anguilla anguilla TaxID=7936 RepID=A0A0E9UXD0_ANGAN